MKVRGKEKTMTVILNQNANNRYLNLEIGSEYTFRNSKFILG